MADKNLRSGLIRLAHAKPELRAQILPLLAQAKSKQATQSKKASDALGMMEELGDRYRKDLARLQQMFLSEIAVSAADIVSSHDGVLGRRGGGSLKGTYKDEVFSVTWSWDLRLNMIIADVKWGSFSKQSKHMVNGGADDIASRSMFKHFNGFIS